MDHFNYVASAFLGGQAHRGQIWGRKWGKIQGKWKKLIECGKKWGMFLFCPPEAKNLAMLLNHFHSYSKMCNQKNGLSLIWWEILSFVKLCWKSVTTCSCYEVMIE